MRFLNRCLDRPLSRTRNSQLGRPLVRRVDGGRRPRPAHQLALAVRAFQKAIRARRRLLRLAPDLFDRAVADREAGEQKLAASLEIELRDSLAKVYGSEDDPVEAPGPGEPGTSGWPTSRRTLQAMEREMAEHDVWLQVGREALRRFQRRQPHASLGLGDICRLLKVADDLGRLATGLETALPKEPPAAEGCLGLRAALQKCYGESNPVVAKSRAGAETDQKGCRNQ